MADETNVEATSTEKTGPDMVDIHDASIEDLDAAYNDIVAEVENQESASAEVRTDQTEQEAPAPDKQAATDKAPAEGEGTDQQQDEYVKKLNQRLEQQELMIKRRNVELGQLRQQLVQKTQQLQAALRQEYDNDPVNATNMQLQIAKNVEAIQGIDEEVQGANAKLQAQQLFNAHVDMREVSFQDMEESLRIDGVPEEAIQQFRADPLGFFGSPEAAILAGKRARAENAIRKITPMLVALYKENEQLKQQLKEAPRSVLKDVERAAKNQPVMNRVGTGSKTPALDPTKMSVNEIDEALRSLGALK